MADGILGGLRAVGEGLTSFTTGVPLPIVRQQLGEARLRTQQQEAAVGRQQRSQELLRQIQGGQAAPGVQPQPGVQAAPQPGGLVVTPIAPPEVTGAPTVNRTQALAQFAVEFPEQFEQLNRNLGLITQQQKDEAADFAFRTRNTAPENREALIRQRVTSLDSQGRNSSDTRDLLTQSVEEQNQSLETVQIAALSPEKRIDIARGGSLTAAQREFAGLTEGLTEEQKKEAVLIKLGISPRAVGTGIQTIASRGIAEEIGNAEATIKERAKFGELKGASRSKAIDSGFARINTIDQNIINLDKAIAAVEAGAGTGAIERRFPSIKAASVLLDQIQGELALDVIGGVTFGALSKGELDLAKQVAIPLGLEGPELIQFLRDKQSAQSKLRAYFNEQIQFLDRGGSVAGFLREKERQVQAGATPQPEQLGPAAAPTQPGVPTQPAAADQQLPEGAIIVNPQTGQRLQVINGQLVEAP